MDKRYIVAVTLFLSIGLEVAHSQRFHGRWAQVGPVGYTGFPTLGAPEPMSGQVSALAVDLKHDPTGNTVYVGSSSGGLWKSTNGLSGVATFIPLNDHNESLSVGAIALDTRSDPVTIYVGSGAPDNSSNVSSYTGTGILISRDGGKKWTTVASADGGTHPFVGLGFSSILIDPKNPDNLLAATGIGVDPNHPYYSVPQGDPGFQNLGIYHSTDAGKTWSQVLSAAYGTQPSGCYAAPTPTSPSGFFHIDLVYEPTGGTYYAGITGLGIYGSTDRGTTWQPLASLGLGKGLPAANTIYRSSLATRDGVLWAFLMMDPCAPPTAHTFALYQSTDHGSNWTQIPDPEPPPAPPPPIGNTDGLAKGALMYVAAPPGSHSLLIATQWLYFKDDFKDPKSPWVWMEYNLHGDQHAIAFVNATVWYAGDDGGAWVTANEGNGWASLNAGLPTLEFFSASADSAGSPFFAGGMQDTGPALTSVSPAWSQLVGGDGTYVVADPKNPNAFFMSENFGDIFYVATSKLPNIPPIVSLNSSDLLAPFELLPADPKLQRGLFDGERNIFKNGSTLLAGGNNPWLIAFDPAVPSNPCQSPPQPNPACIVSLASNPLVKQLTTKLKAPIHYIAPVPSDATKAYLSTGPELYLLSNISFAGHSTLTGITGGPINGDLLGHLAVSFTQPETLYLIKIGFLEGQKIFKTTDGGTSWINISGNLPNVPVNWITLDPLNPDFIYVATNTGVFVASDGGVLNESWQTLGTGLPHVPVTQLRIVPGPKLLAATYGRDVWMLTASDQSVDITPRQRKR